jgi:hypothetical protein
MSPRRKVRTSELSSSSKEKSQWSFVILFILVGGFFLFYMFKWQQDDDYDRFEKAKQYAEYHKEFFVEKPVTFKVLDDMTLMIRSKNLGSDFWSNEFPSMLKKTELEVKEILDYSKYLNERDPDDRLKKKEIDLSSHPEILDILKTGINVSEKSLFNIASGEIFDFWDIAVRRKKLPDFKNLKEFIPFADPARIEIDEEKMSVRINSVNTGIKFDFFKEALFLKKLKEKLPGDDFHYIIFLGDRHGMWFLPEKFVRWTVSIDNPYALKNKARGALKLMPEEGFFVVTRSFEERFTMEMTDVSEKIQGEIKTLSQSEEKRDYLEKLREQYPAPQYIFNPVNSTMNKNYDLPVDWRTGMPAEANFLAMVIDSDPVKARMLSYSLYISNDSEIKEFMENWNKTVFSVLKNDDTTFVPEKFKDLFLTNEEIERLKFEYENKRRGLNPDGSVPEDKKGIL